MEHYKRVGSACRALSASGLLLLLSACATSGDIQGRLGGQPAQLHYRHGFWHQNGAIAGVMPDGEHFSGKFVVGTRSVTGIGVGAGSGDVDVFSGSGNTSDAAAVLMGDQGDSMHCRFTLARPDDGLEGGGVGRCEVSTGAVMDATF
ncbi:MAG TPA: hypothetical protein VFR91_09130 [Dyella sp.]|nr:hypothetical protein [Dyella sp.]